MQGKKPLRKETSRVMRISGENYEAFKGLKNLYAKKHKLEKCTYDEFLAQLLGVAEAFLVGKEVYRVGAQAFDDIAEARGAAILEAVRAGSVPKMPSVLVTIGSDDGFGDHR